MNLNIIELMSIPKAKRDLAWLKNALQNALKLEMKTIPLYLLAYWSIEKDHSVDADHPKGYFTESLGKIFFEEMSHLGLVCNMLTTIGENPKIFPDAVPVFPGKLSEDVKPDLTVSLRKLSKDQLKVFMDIESPDDPFEPPKIMVNSLGLAFDAEKQKTFTTIGHFYDAVAESFQSEDVVITGNKQLTMDLPAFVFEIKTLADALRAIEIIKVQGEGTSQTDPEGDNNPNIVDVAHFYRFREIEEGHRLIKNADGKFIRDPNPLPFPDVFDLADVPAGGFPEASKDFDKLYTELLKMLQGAWENGSQDDLDTASFVIMPTLTQAAKNVIEKKTDPANPHSKRFAPSFLIVEE